MASEPDSPRGREFAVGRAMSLLVVILVLLSSLAFQQPSAKDTPTPTMDLPSNDSIDRFYSIDGYFTENRGQVADGVKYYSTGNPSVGFRDDGVMFVLTEVQGTERTNEESLDKPIHSPTAAIEDRPIVRSLAYFLRFNGANSVAPVGNERLQVTSNFFIGNDPINWRRDVPNYQEVIYHSLYKGIDLVYRQGPTGLKYEFVVDPGADAGAIRMSYEGIESLELNRDGIVARTALGEVHDSPPRSFQGAGEETRCAFVVIGPFSYGFDCKERDISKTLTIDPLVYSTFLGGGDKDGDWWTAITVGSDGSAYVAGDTLSPDFPVTAGAYNTTSNPLGHTDVFVTKLNPAGSALVYSTYLGGSQEDYGRSISVDSAGNAYVTGSTYSPDFPTTPGAYDTTHGHLDSFITELNPTGNALNYSTFLGGSFGDAEAWDIVLDAAGNAYVTGWTDSTDFPTTPGAFNTTLNGVTNDAFVTKLSATGSSLIYSTFLGGSWGSDAGSSISVDVYGDAYVAGYTTARDFPVTRAAFDETYNGNNDVFVTKLDPSGGALVYSTFLGGFNVDQALSVMVDASGFAYVTGFTDSCCSSGPFPVTPGAFNTTGNYAGSAFATKLNANGSALVYSTFLGGSGWDAGFSVAVDSAGNAYVTGTTYSNDFPITPDATDSNCNCTVLVSDGFVMKLNPNGSAPLYSTFLGGAEGTERERGKSIALDSTDNVYVTGCTYSSDFPVTAGAFDTVFNGAHRSPDAFVTKMAIGGSANTPPTVSSFRASVAGEGDAVTFTVNASDADGDVLTYAFDFESDGIFDISGTSDTASRVWGDDYTGTVTVRVSDGKLFMEATTTVVVYDVPPSIHPDIVAVATGNLTLRTAGEKWHDINLTVYKDGVAVANASVIRTPGSPDDQAATIENFTIDLLEGNLSGVVMYTPDDDPINGQPNGATPAWLIFAAKDGSESRIHHTFNVRHNDTWIWDVPDLRALLVGIPLDFKATVSDPGSDDLTFIWDSGDGTILTATTFNNGVSPDPYPSTDLNPIAAASEVSLVYHLVGTYTITLTVTDDDGGLTTTSFMIEID